MQPGQRRTAQRRLRLWRNGFSIDDGPLYRWNDPQTTELVREIRQGRLPRDIAGVGRGEEVELAVEKRENEDYTPTPTALGGHGGGRTFVGQGNRLGRYPA
jgi:UBX domain-containing protein 1